MQPWRPVGLAFTAIRDDPGLMRFLPQRGYTLTSKQAAYEVLARKWRPQRFAEVVGQEHITRTLKNAISQERVGHAYLFVGARGIGKTTTARIFAKALNCEAGLVQEPCCSCQSCQEIATGSSLDVIEIDGASHNKVDDIRDIRDNVQYTPSRSRFKIYIIDEVHMLSTAAWNALLKTLEEPPPHVKFLFATTEPHKVLATIVSRCQRFDLRRIPVPLIMARLGEIAREEQVPADDGALAAIARAADGGMRDAQSIFDQMIAFCGGSQSGAIREQDVIDVFGLASGAELSQVVSGLLSNDTRLVISVVQGLADRGRDLERLFSDTVYCLRNVMIQQLCGDDSTGLHVSGSELNELRRMCGLAEPDRVQRVLDSLLASEQSLRAALNKRVCLEVALVRAMREGHGVQIEDVIARLCELRGEPAPAPPRPPPPPRAVRPEARRERVQVAGPPTPGPADADSGHVDAAVAPRAEDTPPPDAGDCTDQDESPAAIPVTAAPAETPTSESGGSTLPASTPEQGTPAANGGGASPAVEDTAPASTLDPVPQAAVAAPTPPVAPDGDGAERPPAPRTRPSAAAEPPAADRTSGIERGLVEGEAQRNGEQVVVLWHRLVEEVGKVPGRQQLKSYLQELKPVSFLQGVLHAGIDEDVPEEHVEFLQSADTGRVLATCFAQISPVPGGRVLIKRWIPSVSDADRRPPKVSSPEVRERVEKNEFVRRVCGLFDGEVIDVRG